MQEWLGSSRSREEVVGTGGKGELPPVSVPSEAGLGSSEPLELHMQLPVTPWLQYCSGGRACGAGGWQGRTRALQGTWGRGGLGLSPVWRSSSATREHQEPGRERGAGAEVTAALGTWCHLHQAQQGAFARPRKTSSCIWACGGARGMPPTTASLTFLLREECEEEAENIQGHQAGFFFPE